MVLLLLAIMWVGAGVFYFRGRPEGRSADSIGSFRQQLRVLERTAPPAIDPAHRLQASPAIPFGSTAALAPAAGALAGARRRQAAKRRRDVVFGLCVAILGASLLGVVPGLKAMWFLAGVLAVGLLGYVGLLIQLRSRASERSRKVTFLPTVGATAEPVVWLRRSAN